MDSIIRRVRAYLDLKKGTNVLDVFKNSNLGFSVIQTLKKDKLKTELDKQITRNRSKILEIKRDNRILLKYRALLNKN
jgi:hypothetical protein